MSNSLTGSTRDQIHYSIFSCGFFFRINQQINENIMNRSFFRLSSSFSSSLRSFEPQFNTCRVYHPMKNTSSLVCLLNSASINDTLQSLRSSFNNLYRKRAMVHHYTQYCELDAFDEAMEELMKVISSYDDIR